MAFDSGIISFTTKTNKVDLVDAAHINAVQTELVTIETILGVGVKGDRINLKTRLNNALDADGSILSGTSFPSPSLPSQGFYKTDVDIFYIMNAANSQWVAQGGSVGNLLFQYTGQVDQQGSNKGEVVGTTLVPSGATGNYRFLQARDSTITIWTTRWTKISGVTTVTILCRIWGRTGTSVARLSVDIGGQSGLVNGTTGQVTPEWKSFTIDVSSLVNGTTYDVTTTLVDPGTADQVYCSNIIGIGS